MFMALQLQWIHFKSFNNQLVGICAFFLPEYVQLFVCPSGISEDYNQTKKESKCWLTRLPETQMNANVALLDLQIGNSLLSGLSYQHTACLYLHLSLMPPSSKLKKSFSKPYSCKIIYDSQPECETNQWALRKSQRTTYHP